MGHVCARLQLLNTTVKFFFHCCQTPGIFRFFNKRVLAAQGQDKCVCPHEKFFFFLNKRRKKKREIGVGAARRRSHAEHVRHRQTNSGRSICCHVFDDDLHLFTAT